MLNIENTLESKELQEQTEKIRLFLVRSRQWMWVLLVLTLLAPVLSYLLYFSVAANYFKSQFFDYVEAIATAAASQVDPAAHAKMITETGADGAERQAIRERLVAMHKRLPQVYYLTTLVVRDGEGFIAIDTASELPNQREGKPLIPSDYLDQYPAEPEDYENYASITRGEPYIFTEPYTDIFGTFVGGCAPVLAVPGALPTMACVDVDAANYEAQISSFRRQFIYTSGIAMWLSLMILFALYQHQKQMKASMALITQQRDFYFGNANSDALTGALNRRSFALMYEIAEGQYRRWGQRFAIVSLDVDHFKPINDTHGHALGDDVLIELVRAVNRNLRTGDVIARMGGEEFSVLCFPSKIDDALAVAEKLRTCVEHMHVRAADGSRLPVTISAGVYMVKDGDSIDFALKAADMALYHAKSTGRNRVSEYSGLFTSADGSPTIL